MPARARSPLPKTYQQHYPAADSATFKDLLLFEERLKRNAGLLKRRKARYQLYLTLLVGTILILTSDVLLETELFDLPVNTLLFYYTVYRYPEVVEYPHVILSQYLKTCGLFVLGMTLFLFFASGMYSEKVGYANKYVPHANKALRSFNMYLNVRTQPLPSRLSRMASSLGLSFFNSLPPPQTAPPSPTTAIPQRMRTRSLSPSSVGGTPFPSSNYHGSSATEIIPPIPPSTNPRGELIFSSRVHATFREPYERYRENYERKRLLGPTNAAAANAGGRGRVKSLLDKFIPFLREDTATPPPIMTPPPGGDGTSTPGMLGSPVSLRGRTNTLTSTSSASRRSSPAPSSGVAGPSGSGTTGRKGSKRGARGGRISRQGTPLLEIVEGLRGDAPPGMLSAEPGEMRSSGGDELVQVPSLGLDSRSGEMRRRITRGSSRTNEL